MSLFGGAYAGRKVLVTGHTGFKGSWLVAWLRMLGAEVCGYSDGIPTQPSLFEAASLQYGIRHEIGDIRDRENLAGVVRSFRPNFVFHLAAQAIVSSSYACPLETIGVNVMGTATVMDVLRDIEWPCVAVIITSDKVYDNVEWPWGYREIDSLGGQDIYSGSKGGAELVIKSYFHSFFARTGHPVWMTTTRAGNVIGGGDWAADRIVADCIRAWQSGGSVTIRSPNATRPWQHVLDPLSGYLTVGARLAADPSLNGEAFNFGPRAEQNATVLELLHSLAVVWGHDDPDRSYNVTGNIPFHEASLLKLNTDKALLKLRWEANLTYTECMTMTGEWYRDVLKGSPALEVTERHIHDYEELARERHRSWVG